MEGWVGLEEGDEELCSRDRGASALQDFEFWRRGWGRVGWAKAPNGTNRTLKGGYSGQFYVTCILLQ